MFLLSAVSSSMVECGGAALGAGKPADTCLAQPRGAVTMFKSIWGGRRRRSEAQWACGATRARSSSPHHSSLPACCRTEAAAQLCCPPAGWPCGSLPFGRSCLEPTHPPAQNQSLPHLLHPSCQASEAPLGASQPYRQERHCLRGPQASPPSAPQCSAPHSDQPEDPPPTFRFPRHHPGITS